MWNSSWIDDKRRRISSGDGFSIRKTRSNWEDPSSNAAALHTFPSSYYLNGNATSSDAVGGGEVLSNGLPIQPRTMIGGNNIHMVSSDNALISTITVRHDKVPQSPQQSIGCGTEESKSPIGGPLVNANWGEYPNNGNIRHLGSSSMGSVTSLNNASSPIVKSAGVGSGSPTSGLAVPSLFSNIGKLDFGAALRNAAGNCACCKSSNKMDLVEEKTVKIPYITIKRPWAPVNVGFAEEVINFFGAENVEIIFDEGIRSSDIRCLANCGLNHEFIAVAKRQLVKLIKPKTSGPGEAHEMEFIRKTYPAIARDPTVCFPQKCFRLQNLPTGSIYDVVVLEFHEGCMSLKECIISYERASKEDKLKVHDDLFNLVAIQAARLLRGYQNRHNRKHGDAKADNILILTDGRLILCDMGSTFNDSLKPCDRDEFLRSLATLDSKVNDMKTRFDTAFRSSDASPISEQEKYRNVLLLDSLRNFGGGTTTPPTGGILAGAAAQQMLGGPNLAMNGMQGGGLLGANFGAGSQMTPVGGLNPQIRLSTGGGGALNANFSNGVPLLQPTNLNAPILGPTNLLNALQQQEIEYKNFY